MDKSQYLKPRDYEMMAILLPDQGDEQTAAMIETMIGHITGQNGTITSINAESPWGRRRLAYTIRHEGVDYRDGHYVLVYFTAMPADIAEVERDLKLDTNIIRYLLLINDPEMGEKIEAGSGTGESDNTDEDDSDDAATAETSDLDAPEDEEITEDEGEDSDEE